MVQITVKHDRKTDTGWVFKVEVSESGSTTEHGVTVEENYYHRLAPENVEVEDLVEESFRFLLERESKESILNQFDLTVISNYFPEYEDRITERLGS